MYSFALTLFLCAPTYSVSALQSITFVWNNKSQNFTLNGKFMSCDPDSSPCIINVTFKNITKCKYRDPTVKSKYLKELKTIRNDCSGQRECHMTNSTKYILKTKCYEDVFPFMTVALKFVCQRLGCGNKISLKKEDEDNEEGNKIDDLDMTDNDGDDDDLDNVTVIVSSVAGIIATVVLVSTCAVLVCRVQRHVGWVQRWPLSKPQKAAGHTTDHGYDAIEITHATPCDVNPTTGTTLTTEFDIGVGDYCEITTVSVSSIPSDHGGYVPSSAGSRSKTPSRPETSGAKNIYAILEGNIKHIPKVQEPNNLCCAVFSSLASDKHSSTLTPRGSNGVEINIAVALENSEESLIRCNNSNKHPSNKPNQLYNTLDSVGGAYAHLKPIGAQKKIIANVYDG